MSSGLLEDFFRFFLSVTMMSIIYGETAVKWFCINKKMGLVPTANWH